ncbi:hypothetical protein EVAR_60289_1 [Eumeta japonica]|uniref:CRAL-TRIO domain-containing protein n=1 Tax=Eumeta variegata TaxID=151549 RepID=A0A4C1Z5I4_EUMVA|nr:hypothetical protein EVAR_60289_1 [Eumeta japonica]
MQKILSLLKQFTKPKVLDRIMIVDTLDELHKYIDKDYLPKDYGGTQKSISELSEMLQTEFCKEEMKIFFNETANQKSDEDKRLGEKTVDPFAGSFRQLQLD